jgi:hypothetical protein
MFLKKIFSLLFLLSCLSVGVFAQNTSANSVAFTPYTVGTLPTASSNNGRTFRVTDAASGNDCTTGGGTGSVFCTSNGTTYIATPYAVGTGAVVAAAQYSLGCYLTSGTVASVSGCLNIATDSAGDLIVSSSGAAITQTEIADPGAPGANKGSLYENNAYHRWMKYDDNSGPLAIGTWAITTPGGFNVGAQTAINGIYTESPCAGNTTTPGFFTEDGSGNCSWTAINNISNVVYTSQSNVFTSAGALNLGSATSFIIPKSISATAITAGQVVFDTTANNYHGFVGGADALFVAEASAIANNVIPKSCNNNASLVCASGATDSGTNFSIGMESFSAGTSNLITVNKCADTSGSGTAQSCNTTVTFTVAGNSCFAYTTTTANSGASLTINPNSLGATNVAWQGSTALAANYIKAGIVHQLCYDGTNIDLDKTDVAVAATSLAESGLTGSAAQTTITETGIGHEITRAGVETANFTYPYVIQNTNTTTTTSGALGINTVGTGGTGQVPLIINETVAAGDLLDMYTGGSFSSGVFTAGTKQWGVSSSGVVTQLGEQVLPAGTASAPNSQATGSASNTGIALETTANCWTATGTITACLDNLGVAVSNTKVFLFSSTSTANGTADTGVSRDAAGVVDIGTGAQGSTAGNLKLNNITNYAANATVNNGMPFEVGTANSSNSAAITATTLVTPSATALFRISASLQITTAATTSSILGGTTGIVITYTDGTSSVAQSVTCYAVNQSAAIITISAGNTGNTTTSQYNCIPMYIYAKTGVAIQYAIGYTSVGGTAMVYQAHLLAEQM